MCAPLLLNTRIYRRLRIPGGVGYQQLHTQDIRGQKEGRRLTIEASSYRFYEYGDKINIRLCLCLRGQHKFIRNLENYKTVFLFYWSLNYDTRW